MKDKKLIFFLIIFLFFFLLGLFRISQIILFAKDKIANAHEIRGNIYDSQKRIIAKSEKRYNLLLNPNKIKQLHPVYSQKFPKINWNKLTNQKKIVLLKKYLKKEEIETFVKLKDPACIIEPLWVRNITDPLSLHSIIGINDKYNKGVNGLELEYEKTLSLGLELYSSIELKLSTKINQLIRNRNLKAENILVIVMDSHSGNILVATETKEPYIGLNSIHQWRYEPGSVLKPIFLAYLKQTDKLLDNETIFCQGDIKIIGGESIRCTAVHGKVDLKGIIARSCNVGMVLLTDRLSRNEIYQGLKLFGFDDLTQIDLPFEKKSYIPFLQNWGIRTTATIPIGQGFSTTPIQMLVSFNALVNGGKIVTPKIAQQVASKKIALQNKKFIGIKENDDTKQILTKANALWVKNKLLVLSNENNTGRRALNPYYQILGKTSTSQKGLNVQKKTYSTNQFTSSFIGAFPAEDPKYTVLVLIDQPQEKYSGGVVAAPIFKEIIRYCAEELAKEKKSKIYNQNELLGFTSDIKNEVIGIERMPNFIGDSKRVALYKINLMQKKANNQNKKITFTFRGSGYVVKQFPSPKEKFKDETNLKLELRFEAQTRKK